MIPRVILSSKMTYPLYLHTHPILSYQCLTEVERAFMTELDRIREFVRSNLMVFDEGVLFEDDDNIFELGLVDSLFAIQLVSFVEGEFGIDILDSELNIDNFSSVNRIGELVKMKKSQ